MAKSKRRRSRGSGTLFKRASGTYYYQYTDPHTGGKKTKSLRTKSKEEAQEQVVEFDKVMGAVDKAEVMTHIARQKSIIHSKELPVEQVWDEFLKTKPSAGEGTLGLYQRALRDFLDWLRVERPDAVSFSVIDQQTAHKYMEHVWESGVSASTYNDKRNALGLITKKLSVRYNIDLNPWPNTERKKGVQQKRLPLTREQVSKLEKYFEDPKAYVEFLANKAEPKPPASLPYLNEFHCLFRMCLYAGMRLSDAVNLKWDDVDFSSGCIRYVPAKTARTSGVEATVPMLAPLRELLMSLDTDGDYVIGIVHEHFSRNPDYIKVKLIEVLHGILGDGRQDGKSQHLVSRSLYGVHSLRHTFASEAAKAGALPAHLSLMTGDTLQTLQRFYVKVGYQQGAVTGFETLPQMVEGKRDVEPERERLMCLVQEMPLASIRRLLKSLDERS